MKWTSATLLTFLLCVLAPAPLLAQNDGGGETSDDEEATGAAAMRTEGLDDEEARSRFRIGQALYTEGRFLDAAREFESSYRLSGRRSLLYNAYLSYRDAGALSDAVRTLELYLEGDDDAEDVAALRQRLQAMRVTLREEQQAEAESAAERERLAAERAEAQERAEEQRRRADQQRRRAEEAEGGRVGWVVAAAGGALLLGAAIAGGLALNQVGDIEENCPDDRCITGFDLEAEEKEVRRPRLAADILLATGLATIVTGVVILFVGRGGDDEVEAEGSVSGGLGCDTTGCTGTLRTTF